MTTSIPLPDFPSLKEGERSTREIQGTNVLFLRDQDVVHAFENRCPHRGAPLTGAILREGCIQCPWHGLRFHLASGECVTDKKLRLRTFPVEECKQEIRLDVSKNEVDQNKTLGVRKALVRYGAIGSIAWFGTIHDFTLHRGAQVVVESALGLQLGEVLVGDESTPSIDAQNADLRGELIRNATSEDISAQTKAIEFARVQLSTVERSVSKLGHAVSELEATIDLRTLVIWLLTQPDGALGPAATDLATRLGVDQVRFVERTCDEASLSQPNRYNGGRIPLNAKKEEKSMKGPGLRQKHDLDRVWECPICHHRERSSGMETTVHCTKCQKGGPNQLTPFMRLISSPPTAPRRTFQVVSNTPIPVPVVTILGEDAARIPRKQVLRAAAIEANDAKESAHSPQAEMQLTDTEQTVPVEETPPRAAAAGEPRGADQPSSSEPKVEEAGN